jgi:hypothetical protein
MAQRLYQSNIPHDSVNNDPGGAEEAPAGSASSAYAAGEVARFGQAEPAYLISLGVTVKVSPDTTNEEAA